MTFNTQMWNMKEERNTIEYEGRRPVVDIPYKRLLFLRYILNYDRH